MAQAETEFATLCSSHNIWCHKWDHIRKCPICHNVIFKRQSEQADEDSTETIVDYLAFIWDDPWWVECKGTHKIDRINIRDEPSKKQQAFLTSWVEREVNAALFLILGKGRAPLGRKAWLIPWWSWLEEIPELVEDGMISLPMIKTNRKADRELSIAGLFAPYELSWETGKGWTFPQILISDTGMYGLGYWIQYYPRILTLPPLY